MVDRATPHSTATDDRPSRFARFVDGDYAANVDALSAFRICFGVVTLWLGPPSIRGLAGLPDAAYAPPPGLSQIWGGWPPAPFLFGVDVVWIALALAVTVGWRTRTTSAGLAAVTILSSSILFSTGKIDHAIFTAILPLIGGLAGWGESLSLDAARKGVRGAERRRTESWPLALLAGLLAIGFLSAAAPKLAGGWLDPSSQAAEQYFRADYLLRDRTSLLAPAAANVESPLLWELLDLATVVLELGIAVAVLNTFWFRRALLVAIGFHLGVLLVMNISFLALPIVYALLLIPGLEPRAGASLAARVADWRRLLWSAAAVLAVVNLWDAPTTILVSVAGLDRLVIRGLELALVSAAVLWLGKNQRTQTGPSGASVPEHAEG